MAGLCLSLLAADSFGQNADLPEVRIVVRSSMLKGKKWEFVKPAMGPLCDRIQVEAKVHLRLLEDKYPKPRQLVKLGKQLSNGAVEAAVVWGTESAWLLRKFHDLKILCVCSPGGDLRAISATYVKKGGPITNLSQLSGKRVATYPGLTADDLLYQFSLERDKRVRLVPSSTEKTFVDAAKSVVEGESDCVIANRYFFDLLDETSYQNLEEKLEEVHHSAPNPYPAIVGNPHHFDKIQPGLWKELQDKLASLHKTREGQGLIRLWKFEAFEIPEPGHLDLIRAAMKNKYLTKVFDSKR